MLGSTTPLNLDLASTTESIQLSESLSENLSPILQDISKKHYQTAYSEVLFFSFSIACAIILLLIYLIKSK